jgi:hypothetical protein
MRNYPFKGGIYVPYKEKIPPSKGSSNKVETGDVTLILFKKDNLKMGVSFPIKYLCNNLYISILNESEPCHNTNLQRNREYREDGAQGVFAE